MRLFRGFVLALCSAIAMLACCISVRAQETSMDILQFRFLQKAKLIGEAINKSDVDALEREFDPMLRKELPASKLKPLLFQMTEALGKVEKMGDARFKWKGVAVIPVQFEKGFLDMQIAMDSIDQITGIFFLPHEKLFPVPERNTVNLSIPVKGKWNVVWGGDNKKDNYHHDTPNQRYACDLNILDEVGRSHLGDETKNESFFAFGKEIVAPAKGIVVEAIDGVHDNLPFKGNEYSAVGNCVIIQHSDSEYSVLAHFKRGSIRVKLGDTVARDQVLGLCGNSGSSTEPHLHYHLQNTPRLENATGIQIFFNSVILRKKNGSEALQRDYTPTKDDRIERN